MTRWWHSTDFWIVALLAGALFTHSCGPAIAREWAELRQRLDSPAEVVAPPRPEAEFAPPASRVRRRHLPNDVEREELPACRPAVVCVRRSTTYRTCH